MLDRIRILVGVDGSVQSKRALAEAITVAKRFSGSIKAITVYKQGTENKAEEILSEAKMLLRNGEVEFATSSVLGSNPSRALQNTAKQENFDLIVIGNRGLGSKASLLLGSVSREIVASAECNVLVVKK